jgi:ABC-type sulfate transport system permease component
MFTLFFLGMFFMLLIGAEIQAAANPGIERIEEPSFWFSAIYNAWLYVTDREEWAYFASLLASVLSFVFGSLFGWILSMHLKVSGVSLVSWLVGLYLLFSIAIFTATSRYWQKSQQVPHLEEYNF